MVHPPLEEGRFRGVQKWIPAGPKDSCGEFIPHFMRGRNDKSARMTGQ